MAGAAGKQPCALELWLEFERCDWLLMLLSRAFMNPATLWEANGKLENLTHPYTVELQWAEALVRLEHASTTLRESAAARLSRAATIL